MEKRTKHILPHYLTSNQRLARCKTLGYYFGNSSTETRYDSSTLINELFWTELEVDKYNEAYFDGVIEYRKRFGLDK